MTEKKVSLRYAKAIFEVAKEKNLLDQSYNDMILVKKMVDSSRELQVLLKSLIINKIKKTAVIDGLFKNSINELTFNFLNLLIDKQREALIVDIIIQFELLYNEEKNIQIVEITTANELSDILKQKIMAKLSDATGKIIQPHYSINKNIKGGLLIRMDNWVYDASITRQLEMLRHQLLLGANI